MGSFDGQSYPVAERIYQRGFYVPSGLALTLDQIQRVVSTLMEVFGGGGKEK
jgi:perosamine synthetase